MQCRLLFLGENEKKLPNFNFAMTLPFLVLNYVLLSEKFLKVPTLQNDDLVSKAAPVIYCVILKSKFSILIFRWSTV